MEAGALSAPAPGRPGGGAPIGAAGRDLDGCGFEPLRPWLSRSDPRSAGRIDLELLNRFAAERLVHTEAGLPVRFVDAARAPAGPYERVIGESGSVPTRASGPGMLHDWFNALAWLAFPRIKARLNRLHVEAAAASSRAGVGAESVGVTTSPAARRGPLRDAATLLDESGALFVCRDPALAANLRRRDWRALFVDGRRQFTAGASIHVLGHGVLEKLLAPYKALCAHAWVIEVAPDTPAGTAGAMLDALDQLCAGQLRSETLCTAALCPLPLLGVPQWWPGNASPAFYDDADVFRTGRRQCKIIDGAGRTVAGCGAKAPLLEEGPDSTGQDAG